jgi:hypothetical protein
LLAQVVLVFPLEPVIMAQILLQFLWSLLVAVEEVLMQALPVLVVAVGQVVQQVKT